VKIGLKKITDIASLSSIWNLYCVAFPLIERRELESLQMLIDTPECQINQITIHNEQPAGLCIYWTFREFLFLEHFAVEPELRGLGIGERILLLLREKCPLILLETEPPVDEITARRVKFYQRNGFKLLHRQYFQPSYGENKPPVELKLMSNSVDFTAEELDKYIATIRKKVYRIQ
jgi:ribosomal protein S18 acetylase RimI-like enzyme